MDRKIELRLVEQKDLAATRKLVDDAFKPEDVVTFLDSLRADGCILGEWLAEDSSGALGHIVFSRAWVELPNGEQVKAAMLTPLAVRPDRQRVGTGTQLMDFALKALEARGEALFFVLGHPEYYPRAGFCSVAASRVASRWSGWRSFMARGVVPEGRLVPPAAIADAHV
jgi:putative acetyltransferase